MNLPNTLTLARIFLVPLLVVVLLTRFEAERIFGMPRELLGAAIFGTAAFTDWLDGYLARRRRQVTQLGQLMDPLADKLLITAALVSLVQMGMASAWMVAVILGRELAITVFRSLTYTRGVTIPASSLGKVKMVTQVVAILLLILGNQVWLFWLLGQVALWLVLVASLWSAVDYYRRFGGVLAHSKAGHLHAPAPRGNDAVGKTIGARAARAPKKAQTSARERGMGRNAEPSEAFRGAKAVGYGLSRSMATFSSAMRRLASSSIRSVVGNSAHGWLGGVGFAVSVRLAAPRRCGSAAPTCTARTSSGAGTWPLHLLGPGFARSAVHRAIDRRRDRTERRGQLDSGSARGGSIAAAETYASWSRVARACTQRDRSLASIGLDLADARLSVALGAERGSIWQSLRCAPSPAPQTARAPWSRAITG